MIAIIGTDEAEFRRRAAELRSQIDFGASFDLAEIGELLGMDQDFITIAAALAFVLKHGEPVLVTPDRARPAGNIVN